LVTGGRIDFAFGSKSSAVHVDPEAKARASGSEREMGQARARENFSRSEREK